ncbi:acyl carrier protein [Amycolatopsis sp. NPDC004079]|uniref:acyl carrier protein n=1 Tax=Amycolatopsis sp. NPDC004079 TaxID=3154549 RepID=UPI00339E0200
MTDSATSTGVQNRSENELREQIRGIVVSMAPESDQSCEPETVLIEGLGYHSLALLELAFTLEDEFDLQPIDEQTARGITTVKDVEDIVVRMLSENPQG